MNQESVTAIITLVLVVCLGLACNIGDGDGQDEEFALPEPYDDITEEQVLEAVYSEYKFPDNFYQEELQSAYIYYENTISITPLEEREHIWIELCTDDKEQALAWSELSAVNSSDYLELEPESHTKRYFEFRRQREGDEYVMLSRVHKCSYLDRSMYDRFRPGPIIGVFGERPVTESNVRALVEYLWFIQHYNTSGRKVLRSETRESEGEVIYTLLELFIVGGDFGIRDEITVLESSYQVEKENGTITFSSTELDVLLGHLN